MLHAGCSLLGELTKGSQDDAIDLGVAAPGVVAALSHPNRKVQRHGCMVTALLAAQSLEVANALLGAGCGGPLLTLLAGGLLPGHAMRIPVYVERQVTLLHQQSLVVI